MKLRLLAAWTALGCAAAPLHAQLQNGQQPDFVLPDINPDSVRNTTRPPRPDLSPRHYRQQISAYYFSQEYCPTCQAQFTQLQGLSDALKGTTDLPIVITGIHLLGGPQDPAMFEGKSLSWVRENATHRPWQSWRVPVSSRPGQEIRWRDLVIVDENNRFVAVQNFTETPITNPTNYNRLRNTLVAAASIADSDIDGIPDRWELDQTAAAGTPGNLAALGTLTPAASGTPGLLAYAFSMPLAENRISHLPVVSTAMLGSQTFLQMQYRRRLGLEGERLGYLPERSATGAGWTHLAADWTETAVVNPFDGSGTEIVTLRRSAPITGGRELIRLRISAF